VHPQACGGTPLSGQHCCLFSPLEKRDNARDEEEDDYEDATEVGDDLCDCDDLMSRMSVNDQHEEDSFSVITGYRSLKSLGGRASHQTNNNSTITSDSSKSFSYGCSNINLPYVMFGEIWIQRTTAVNRSIFCRVVEEKINWVHESQPMGIF
jgi:hypothetical protein